MAAPTALQLARVSPVELVDAVRTGRIRYPNPGHPSATEIARTLDGLQRRYPQRPVLLWQDPDDPPDAPAWLLDGGDLLSALLRATGALPARRQEEPVLLDTDSGEVVAWGQRPADGHVVLDVRSVLAAAHLDAYLAAEHLVGPRAERVRTLVESLRDSLVPVQVVNVARSELPRLIRHLRGRSGVSPADLDQATEPHPGPPASYFAWSGRPRALVIEARGVLGDGLPAEDLWRALVVAEGRDPDEPYAESAAATDLPDEGRPAAAAVREAQHVVRGAVGYPGGPLLPETRSLAAMARFLRVFPVFDEALRPLLRRWVWRTALAGHDIDLTPAGLSVIRDDAARSAVRLLERAPIPVPVPPGRDELDLGSRRGRLVLLGLAALHPRDLLTGLLIDIEQVRPELLLPDRLGEPANVVIHDRPWIVGRTLRQAVESSDAPDLLASHGIDGPAADLLRAGDEESFLARRAATLDRVVLGFWSVEIEPSAAVRRPVALLFEDDDGDW